MTTAPSPKTSGPRPRGDYICIWAHVTPSIFFFPKRVYRGWVPSSEGLGGGVSVIESLCLDTLYLDVGR